jgi:hypothetical protein
MPQGLPEQVSLCFYRVAQEALTNALKHSQSPKVDVNVVSNGRVLSMRIRDFGVGFDPAVPREGLGLVTMQERLRMIGGVLRFHSLPGRGAELEAEANIQVARLPAQAPKIAVPLAGDASQVSCDLPQSALSQSVSISCRDRSTWLPHPSADDGWSGSSAR